MCIRDRSKFLSEELDDVYVVYTDMISSMKEEAKLLQILPFRRERFENLHSGKHREIHHTATFDPSPEIVMENLVPNYAKGLIYGTMVEAFASEQHARMMAMEGATNSAKQMLKELDIEYNRARQAAITQEITEVIAGAKSQKKKKK